MSRTFGERLAWCVDRGNLTVADLARWFDRPYQTVRWWLHHNVGEPGDGPGTRARMSQRLEALEAAVRADGTQLRRLSMSARADRLQQLAR
jgi:hypothetical protein